MNKIFSWLIDNIVVLFTIGYALYLLARREISQPPLQTDDLLAGILAVLGLLATSEFIERHRKIKSIHKISKRVLELLDNGFVNRQSALSFFQKLPNLDAYIHNSNQIDICGVTLTSAINGQKTNLLERLQRGAHIRIMVIDPKSPGLEMTRLRSERPDFRRDYFGTRLRATFQDLEDMYDKWTTMKKDRRVTGEFSVRLLPYAPSFGIYAFNPHQRQGITLIEMYPHRTGYNSPPCFDVIPTRDGDWYIYFLDQFEHMWRGAVPWKPPSS